ncbi:MAG: YeeE/YedE family protein [Rhodospirillales bacterium]
MRAFASLISGVLFGLGLAVSNMINPAKVIGFLDVAGAWDPSLAFVLGGAVAVTAVGYRFVIRRDGPLFEGKFQIPSRRDIDMPLLAGAAVFGIGWGLVGLCPGPAIAGLAVGLRESAVFVLAMFAGMTLYRFSPFDK